MITLNNPVWGKRRLATLSPSKINAYLRCGERFRLEYVEEFKPPSGPSAHRGTGLHAAIEEDMKYFMLEDRRLKIDDLLRIGNEAFDEKLYEEGVFIPAKDEKDKDKIIDKARAEMIQSIELYSGMEKPLPDSVEMNINMDIGYPLPVKMRPDLVDRNNTIWDWKTTAKSSFFEVSLQDLMYSKAYEILEGVKPVFKYCKFILTKKNPHVEIQEIMMPDDYAILDRYIERYLTAIENNIFLPACNTNYLCSEGGCPFYLNCDYKHNRYEYLE